MTTTTNLELTELDANLAEPEVILNDSLEWTDRAIAGIITHNIASDADYTLSIASNVEEWRYSTIKVTDSGVLLTATRNIIVPVNTKPYIFINGTAQSLVLKTSAGTGITVLTNKAQILLCDGTNVIAIAAAI